MAFSVRPLSSAALTQMLLHGNLEGFLYLDLGSGLVFDNSNDACRVTCEAANNVAYYSADDAVREAASVSEATSSVPSLRRSL